MIHNIRAAFNEILEESSWMDDETKAVAKEKVGWFCTFKVLSSDKCAALRFRKPPLFCFVLDFQNIRYQINKSRLFGNKLLA